MRLRLGCGIASPGKTSAAFFLLVQRSSVLKLFPLMRGPETEYNQMPYPPAIYSQTHPDRLATIGTLFGLSPARVDDCRVLELGCGDGTNSIAMASAMP